MSDRPTPTVAEQLVIIARTRLAYGIDGAGFVHYRGTDWHYLGPAHKSDGGHWLEWDRSKAVLYSPAFGSAVVADITEVYVT